MPPRFMVSFDTGTGRVTGQLFSTGRGRIKPRPGERVVPVKQPLDKQFEHTVDAKGNPKRGEKKKRPARPEKPSRGER